MKKIGLMLIAAGLLITGPSAVKNIGNLRSWKVSLIASEDTQLEEKAPLIIEELFLSDWIRRGYSGLWQPGLEMPFENFNSTTDTVLIFNEQNLYRQARKVFSLKIPGRAEYSRQADLFYIKIKDIPQEKLKVMGMGFIESAKKLSLENRPVYIRPLNDQWVNGEYIRKTLGEYEFEGIIFKGNKVSGYPDHMETLKKIIEKKDPLLFSVEFSPQKGLAEIADGQRIVRLHSVPRDLPVEDLNSRILRGVRERNIRAVYLKSSEHIELRGEIKTALEKNNFTVGPPPGLRIEDKTQAFLLAGAALILLGLLMVLGAGIKTLAVAAALMAVAAFVGIPYLRWGLSAGIGILLPVFAVSYASKGKSRFWSSLLVFVISSVLAGLIINTLYALPSYIVKLQQIRGIKFMLLAPPAAAAAVLFKGADMKSYIKGALSRREFIYILVALLLGGLYLVRSSNSFPSLVGSFEIQLRSFMENLFIWRPRFKEFLVGHPALITGLYLFKKSNLKDTLPKIIIIAGVVGQASVINSFMHIHTPILGTLIRTFWGYILGAFAALVVILIIKRWQKRKI